MNRNLTLIINVFTATFNQFNVSFILICNLLNDSHSIYCISDHFSLLFLHLFNKSLSYIKTK